MSEPTFAEVLKAALHTCGLNQLELARLIDRSPQAVSLWCRGTNNAPIYARRAIVLEIGSKLPEESRRLLLNARGPTKMRQGPLARQMQPVTTLAVLDLLVLEVHDVTVEEGETPEAAAQRIAEFVASALLVRFGRKVVVTPNP